MDKNTAILFPILLRVAQLIPILLGYLFLNREGVKILDVTRSNAVRTSDGDESPERATGVKQPVMPK